ncbi:ACP S-malonyltransferase [Peribacillus simplex]|uniref:ACP S-malonyltransferase n=1 Tax=Peribacillus simplex TaxID=1478 RepID=UPI000F62EDB5|nr:ACP S-malonyltransferase [Peribacillus simplex]RRN69533.1 ACP S-malonyltransferase [Peribacillus simplex]
MKSAILFPPLMKLKKASFQDLYEEFPEVRNKFEESSEILEMNLASQFFSDDEELTNNGLIARSSIVTISAALFNIIKDYIPAPDFYLGPSLGQVIAIHCSGSLSFKETIKMVRAMCEKERSEEKNSEYGVYFFYNIDTAILLERMAELKGQGCTLEPCMFGTANQMIVNGDLASLEKLSEKAMQHGGLGVTIPYGPPGHCSLLQSVKEAFERDFMPKINPKAPEKPLISNVTATALTAGWQVEQELVEQYTNPVQWYKSLQFLAKQGIEELIVMGPGNFVSKALDFTDIPFRVERLLTADEINKKIQVAVN